MKRFFLICLWSLFAVSAVQAQEDVQGTLTYDNQDRGYFLRIPAGYDEAVSAPLLLVLHGSGMTGLDMMMTTGFNETADESGHIVAYPTGLDRSWMYLDEEQLHPDDVYTDDVNFVYALIDDVAADYNIDSERIYVAGYSNGGLMALRMGCESGERFAGIVGIGVNMTFRLVEHCIDSDPVSYMLVVGTRDQAFAWAGDVRRLEDGKFVGRMSGVQTFNFLGIANNCGMNAEVDTISSDSSPLQVFRNRYTYCQGGETTITQYLIVGGDHSYPFAPRVILDNGEESTFRELIWEFITVNEEGNDE